MTFIEEMQASLLPQQFTMEFEAEFVEDMDGYIREHWHNYTQRM
jgi:hypothetical protein